MGETIIRVKDLHVHFYTNQRCNRVLNGISFDIRKGRTLCVVGESGCGKSVTANAIMRLLPELARIEGGSISYLGPEGEVRIDSLERNGRQMRKLRGEDIAIIFQDPMTALNPVYSIGFQINEMLQAHDGTPAGKKRSDARRNSKPQVPAATRVRSAPHSFLARSNARTILLIAKSPAECHSFSASGCRAISAAYSFCHASGRSDTFSSIHGVPPRRNQTTNWVICG